MKKLQRDFTTPEQSKRLLELGVPEWTANLYAFYIGETIVVRNNVYERRKDFFTKSRKDGYKPIWSVGRLIGMYEICTGKKFVRTDDIDTILEDVLYQIKFNIININCEFDFSKLED